MTNFVHNTVNGLKSLLDEKGTIQLFCSEGDIMECLVTFSPNKATLNDIQSFEAKHQLTLSEDYQKFFTLHNGAKIFQILADGEKR
ncbi:SMI1/KNR4 family protein, partial [Bacillus inaquosorum]|uniref:SMI1/KNR4 family protein n=1 Tax=Bacillus inaquosorum TaxID=483913 RepID=UPI0022823C2A